MTAQVAPRLLPVRIVAALLGVHPATVRRMIARGELPSVRVGNRVLMHRNVVAQLERVALGGAAPPPLPDTFAKASTDDGPPTPPPLRLVK
ncbi:MAG: helix-turn-helix domain-containing protein [Kofleriaceae bacterium]